MRKSEEGGVACGICRTSLQQASLGFGVADVVHGIIGVAIVVSMLVKKENDIVHKDPLIQEDRLTGYTKFLRDKCSWAVLFTILGALILQIALGVILCVGASKRISFLCMVWFIGSVLACVVIPMTYSLLALGRIYEWATVGEFVWKMGKEKKLKFYQIKNVRE